jgi:hypothetical protein
LPVIVVRSFCGAGLRAQKLGSTTLKPVVLFLDTVEFETMDTSAQATRHEVDDLARFATVDDGHVLKVLLFWSHFKLPANPLHIASFGVKVKQFLMAASQAMGLLSPV